MKCLRQSTFFIKDVLFCSYFYGRVEKHDLDFLIVSKILFRHLKENYFLFRVYISMLLLYWLKNHICFVIKPGEAAGQPQAYVFTHL